MKKHDSNNQWLTSKEARKKLKISGCKLMHLREAGILKYKKVGNAYFYDLSGYKL